MKYEAVIGLEIHAELATRSKMFCSCALVDSTSAAPNRSVCPVCSGMPGVLPVLNRQAVELGLRVALALGCTVNPVSIFARKNYFYPDLPKGYQISQYEQPLAVNGRLPIETPDGWREVHIRRVHLEEDTAKLTHVHKDGEDYSLVDLNRAGVPLLEIVTEPDLHTAQEVRAYAASLRSLLRYLGASSGDMEKAAMRIEPNLSIRPTGSQTLGTRVEIKNLNSFRALERAVAYQIEVQSARLDAGLPVVQETVGWDEAAGETFSQRSKEEAHDYRYFPEPDLPPLVVDEGWVARVRSELPELPWEKVRRYIDRIGLPAADARQLAEDLNAADLFDPTVRALQAASARMAAAWINGELAAWLNANGQTIASCKLTPEGLAELLDAAARGDITLTTAKSVLGEMLAGGRSAGEIVRAGGLEQVSDAAWVAELVRSTLADNPGEVEKYRAGKESVAQWLFGQVMRAAQGRANPQVVRAELERRLRAL